MVNKQKIKNVIKLLLTKEVDSFCAPGPYCAPSQQFDTVLRKNGFVPPIKLWHQYKFPSGFTDISFEKYIHQ